MAKGKDKEQGPEDAGLREYVWALQILDSEDGLGDIIGDILTANGGDIDASVAQVGSVLARLRDVIRLRGWKPQPGTIQLAFRAKVSGWQPKVTPEASTLRLNLDISYPAPEALPILWDALGKPHDVIMRGARQAPLGEVPPVWDIDAVIDAHEGGVHRILPDMECPMCLLEAAARTLAAIPPDEPEQETQEGEDGEPEGGD